MKKNKIEATAIKNTSICNVVLDKKTPINFKKSNCRNFKNQ